ncbi:MAG: AI-2E family transporter [Cyanobacteriota bacterium]|nr:AI-2E family transporter [Cyanobacteriota bacterium]
MLKSLNQMPRWLSLSLAFPLFFLNGWLLLSLIQYFRPLFGVTITAILLSFVLDYPVKFLQKLGVKRTRAVVWVLLLAIVIFTVLGILLIPIILGQLSELINRLPGWIESGAQQLQAFASWTNAQEWSIDISNLAIQITDRLSTQLQTLTSSLLTFAFDTIGGFVNLFLTLVLTFYLILSGEQLWQGIFAWLPSPWDQTLRQSLHQNFHNYFTGQAILAAVLGSAITIAFLVLGVPFGLLFGIGIGGLSIIPFGGVFSIIFVSLLVTLQNFWLGIKVLIVSILIGQVNDNIVAPRLLGGITGLNPVWILLSLLVGAKLAGVLGLLLAVPLASFIKVTADALREVRHSSPPPQTLVLAASDEGSAAGL